MPSDREHSWKIVVAMAAAACTLPVLAACGTASGDSASASPSTPTEAGTPTPLDTALPALPDPNANVEGQIDQDNVSKALVGLSLSEAQGKAGAAGYSTRIVSQDGDQRPVTMDYQSNRINLTVVNGKVTEANIG